MPEPTPDLRTLAAEAILRVDMSADLLDLDDDEQVEYFDQADAVLAAVLPAVADAVEALKDRYHQDLVLDSPADTAAYRAGRQATTDAAALVRRLANPSQQEPDHA